MAQVTWQEGSEHLASIIGYLTRDTVPALWRQLQDWQPKTTEFEVCLKQLERVDSAGMVMLIHLLQHAKNMNCHIMLTFMPDQLQTLFKLSNIDEIFLDHIQPTEI
ncbi:STAS domain-containing protein [Vibrio rumoiensis]|uniref:NTP-binding protein n=1 Tax=Vibrio rumoiensis 1S-45 TaxID=1188252 RepID=A0A1E5E5N1_9VIBR|nr:STAS domain-containing protein [Vibrio rumoiensis]OEF28439.1 NTP-binding protein [Vibrio rumoiensis 1S-45]